jgi:hypothetical protein
MLDQQNHAAGGANGSIMVGMFVCLCLTSKKPSEREFFVPAGTDLGVKLLTHQVVEYRIDLTKGTFTLLKINYISRSPCVDPLIPGYGQTIPRSVSRTRQHHLNSHK